MENNKQRKLHLKIHLRKEGTTIVEEAVNKIKRFFDDFTIKRAARKRALRLGLTPKEINHAPSNHVELVLEGDKENLWKMISWARTGAFLTDVNEVRFKFSDIEVLEYSNSTATNLD